MKRPDYWRELTEPGDIVPAGCPYREERPDGAPFHYSRRYTVEAESVFDHYRYAFDPRSRVFIDSRWEQRVQVGSKVGAAQMPNLPQGTIIRDAQGTVHERVKARWSSPGEMVTLGSIAVPSPVTVIWLPA